MQTKEESLEMKLKARDLEIETLKDTLSMSNTHRLGGFKNIVPNVLQIGDVADFGTQNFLQQLNLI